MSLKGSFSILTICLNLACYDYDSNRRYFIQFFLGMIKILLRDSCSLSSLFKCHHISVISGHTLRLCLFVYSGSLANDGPANIVIAGSYLANLPLSAETY